MTVPGVLRIRVLGQLRVDDVPVDELGSRKARTLLTALAVTDGRTLPTAEAIDVVWGARLPSAPNEQLSVLVSRLRRAVGADRIIKGDGGYRLRADRVDATELGAFTDEATARLAAGSPASAAVAATAAVALDHGALAAGETSEWFDGPRAVATRQLWRARSVLAEAALAVGDHRTAAANAEALLDADPYDEAALATLMRARAAGGRPSSALAEFARMRRRLRDDLGVDPSPALAAVHQALLLGDDGRPSASTAIVDVVGRDRELRWLAARLDGLGDGADLVAVVGESGIGKSALVAAFAEQAASAGADVLVGRCDPLGRDLPLQPIMDAVGGRSTGRGEDRDDLHDRLLAAVGGTGDGVPTVLVIEDIHVAAPGTIAWLHRAARRGRRLLIVVTGRPEGPGQVSAAAVLELGPLDAAAVERLVGPARAGTLMIRSGGVPLLLVQLARSDDDDQVPESITAWTATRVGELGANVATTITAAAVLGPRLDLDLLTAVLNRPVGELLDAIDVAVASRLLRPDGAMFTHEVVREALAASVTSARRTVWHRTAADVLAARLGHDPTEIAWQARLGGAPVIAAGALRAAAAVAARRFEPDEADRLLGEALTLHDDPDIRRDRARARLAARRLDDAKADIDLVLAASPDSRTLEVAGWIAYYRRDHEMARVYADEGIARAGTADVRASLLALAGRQRHGRGRLAEAEQLLRNLGRLDEADALSRASAELPDDLEHAEPRFVAQLDLVESAFLAADMPAVAERLADLAPIERWDGAMAWRQRARYRLAQARHALAGGDRATAARLAGTVAAEAAASGSPRAATFAALVVHRAGPDGPRVDTERAAIDGLLDRLDEIAGLEAWWMTAEVAASFDDDTWWTAAADRLASLVARAGPAGDRLAPFADTLFTRWR